MSFLRFPLFAVVALLIVQPARATTVKTGKPAAAQPSARPYATRDQLVDCLDTEAGLKTRFKAIEATNNGHEQLFNQVQAENDKLVELQAQLDHDSETSIRAFNGLIKEHNLHVKQLNQDAADSQPVSNAYNDDMVAFNHKCAKLVYRVDDMEAVMKERKKAAAAAAASVPLN
ncbi:MAG: hypothetical protein ABIR54_00515 [Burkholderiaceae bacterium]